LHYFLLLILSTFFISGCSRVVYITKPCYCPCDQQQHQNSPNTKVSNPQKQYYTQVKNLRKKTAKHWGKKAKIASRYEYVKYSQNYKARTIINFQKSLIKIETTASKKALRHVIATALLSPEDPQKIDLFRSRSEIQVGVPFLFHRIHDNEGKPIRWRWRAYKYADYLIAHKLKVDRIRTTSGYKKRYSVNFKMKKERFSKKSNKHYSAIVKAQAKRFGLKPALIFAIIETESQFNPYAISPIPAYGLMQIVPNSAGKDAWRLLKKRSGKPSRNYLFNARNNIEMGTAYMHILLKRYLYKIKNPLTREYCAIAAYNTGSGNVLRSFSRNKKVAIRRINKLSPQAVYNHLRKKLPYQETKRYIKKVVQAKKRYL
jgi:membrane-bound lytic murein transglycosylase C